MQPAGNSLAPQGLAVGPWPAALPLPFWLRALGFGFLLTLVQVVLACAMAGSASPTEAYTRLSQWDSHWYSWIVDHGYVEPRPGVPEGQYPVGFFPGYPVVGRLVMMLTGLPANVAVILGAQIASLGFWIYILLFLRRMQSPWWLSAAIVAAVGCHPCAFYLVAGYSESLFLLGLLGFLYWSTEGGWRGWLLAAIHGLIMTSTRIVGLPLVVVPVIVAVASGGLTSRRLSLLSSLALGGLACLGGLAFFAYCQAVLGHWDLYLAVQKTGWGVRPDYLAVFRPDLYRLDVPLFVDGHFNPNALSRLCVPFTVLAGLGLLVLEMKAKGKHLPQRLGFYAAAALMFFVAISGLANSGLVSMIRYTFCVHVMLALAAAHVLMQLPAPAGVWRWVAGTAFAAAVLVSMTLQVVLISYYTHGEWVS